MKTRVLLTVLMAAAAIPLVAIARDPRMTQIGYDPHAVTTLHGCFGFQSTIAFAPGEQVENVALGDAALWQATPNKRADLLFLKPATHNGRTNMMVVTDRRRYAFDLIARDDADCRTGRVTYELQFTSPPDPVPAPLPAAAPSAAAAASDHPSTPPAPALRNVAYTFTGSATNVPERVFDDGHSTYLRWADGVAVPAIYTLGPGKTETVVNYVVKGDYVVVDGVARALVLRQGSAMAVLYNDAYQEPKLDGDAPRPRSAPRIP